MSIIALSLFIIIVILTIYRPHYGIYATAAALPMIGKDFYMFGLIVPFADLVALASLLGFLLNRLYSSAFKQDKTILTWPLFFPFFLFFLAQIISIMVNGGGYSAWYYFLRWPVFLYLAYIFVPANAIKNAKVLKNTVLIVAASAVLVLTSGFLSLLAQDWRDSFFRLKSVYLFNSYPFGENHNLVAEFLNVGTFFILIIKEFVKEIRWRKIINVLFVLFALGIILTFSKTGWITLILQTAVYMLYRFKYKTQERLPALILILMFFVIATPLLLKMNSLQQENTSSTENRIILTQIAFDAFKEKPLFGHGSGQFVSLVEKDIRFTTKYGPPVDSHGSLQKVMAENGVLGLLTWLFLLMFLVRFSVLAINKYYPKVAWVLPFAMASLGGIFFQFFNTSYYKGKVWFPIVLFILAIKISESKYDKKNKDTPYPA